MGSSSAATTVRTGRAARGSTARRCTHGGSTPVVVGSKAVHDTLCRRQNLNAQLPHWARSPFAYHFSSDGQGPRRKLERIRAGRVDEMSSNLAHESQPPEDDLNLTVSGRRHEVEIAGNIKTARVDLDDRTAGEDGGDTSSGQRGRHRRRHLFDRRRRIEIHQRALPLRRGRVRRRKCFCCSPGGNASSVACSSTRSGGTRTFRGFHS